MVSIELTIGWTEAGDLRSITRIDGAGSLHPVSTAGTQLQDLRKIVEEYHSGIVKQMDQGRAPLLDSGLLRELGTTLFAATLGPSWAATESHCRAGATLFIRSKDAELLAWPWEVMLLPNGNFVGCDPAWRVARLPNAPAAMVELTPGPLRTLFMVASPLDAPELDYEQEEDRLWRALDRGAPTHVRIADGGSLAELGDVVGLFRPHIVYLSGHGSWKNGGSFAFEDENWLTDSASGERLGRAFAGTSVRCVLLNACWTASPRQGGKERPGPVAGLCQQLVAQGVPLTLGWTWPIGDTAATIFGSELFHVTSTHNDLGRAAQHGRIALLDWARGKQKEGDSTLDASFSMIQLYAATDDVGQVYDEHRVTSVPAAPTERQWLGNGVEGLIDGFVGRRRDLQRLIPPLLSRGNDSISVAVLTGIGGVGKSTVATHVANRLRGAGYRVATVGPIGSVGGRLSGRRRADERASEGEDEVARSIVSDILIEVRKLAALEQDAQQCGWDPSKANQQSDEKNLSDVLELLKKHKCVLVLDNLDDALAGMPADGECPMTSGQRPRIANLALATFLQDCCQNLTTPHGGRLLITSRYLPTELNHQNAPILHCPLSDFSATGLRKLLLRDEVIKDKSLNQKFGCDGGKSLIDDLHRTLGGTPRFAEQVLIPMLRLHDERQIRDELQSFDVADSASETELELHRQKYLDDIAAPLILRQLGDAAHVSEVLALAFDPVPADSLLLVLQLLTDKSDTRFITSDVKHLLDVAIAWGVIQVVQRQLPAVDSIRQMADLLAEAPEAILRCLALAGGWFDNAEGRRSIEHETTWTACYQVAGLMRETLAARLGAAEQRRVHSHYTACVPDLDSQRRHAIAAEKWPVACKLALLQSRPLLRRGARREARAFLEQIPPEHRDDSVVAELASIDMEEYDFRTAERRLRSVIEIAQGRGDVKREASALHDLANIAADRGDCEYAETLLTRCITLRREIGDVTGEALSLANLGTMKMDLGDGEGARKCMAEAVDLARKTRNRNAEAAALHGMAAIDFNEGQFRVARDGFDRALRGQQELRDRRGEGAAWHQLALIDLAEGNPAAARTKLENALTLAQEVGERGLEAASLHGLASIVGDEGDSARARGLYEQAMSIDREINNRSGEAERLNALGNLDLQEDNPDSARKRFERALTISNEIGNPQFKGQALLGLASTDLHEKNNSSAKQNYTHALSLFQSSQCKPQVISVLQGLAEIDIREGHYSVAYPRLERALKLARELKHPLAQAECWRLFGTLLRRTGHLEQGLTLIAVHFSLLDPLGHAHAESSRQTIQEMADELGWDELRVRGAINHARQGFDEDGGDGLLRTAYNEWESA